MINGQPPVAPPDIPGDRLNLPPIPVAEPQEPGSSFVFLIFLFVVFRSSQYSTSQTDQGQQTQHMPGQQSTGSTSAQTATTSTGPPPPPQGNTFLNGPPPPVRRRTRHRRPTARRPRRARLPARLLCRLRRRPHRRHHPRRGRHLPNSFRRHRHQGSSRVAVRMSPQRFDELVSDALDLIPPELAAAIDNVVVLVEDRNPEEPDLLGLYQGVALTERDSWYAGSLPDTITIYRDALLDMCEDEDEVVDEVAITVIHEIAHHFGIDDDRLHELGWG